MAGGLEAAIHAILTGLLNMQQLYMELTDRLEAEGWSDEEEEQATGGTGPVGKNQKGGPRGVPGVHPRPANFRERPGPLGGLHHPISWSSPGLRGY